jgi:DNA-binding NtrC family response regulator
MKTILLVDDDQDVRNCLSEMIARCGCQSIGASDGEAAMAVLRGPYSPDLVMVDYRMPGMSGLEFARRVKEKSTHLPIVMMTGQGDLEGYLGAHLLGIDLYLQKPIRLTELRQVITRAGGRKTAPGCQEKKHR